MSLIIEAPKGENVYGAARYAIAEAKRLGSYTRFRFNDIEIDAHPDSRAEDLVSIYGLHCEVKRLKSKR